MNEVLDISERVESVFSSKKSNEFTKTAVAVCNAETMYAFIFVLVKYLSFGLSGLTGDLNSWSIESKKVISVIDLRAITLVISGKLAGWGAYSAGLITGANLNDIANDPVVQKR